MKTLIRNARIVNAGRIGKGSILVTDDVVTEMLGENDACPSADSVIDAEGLWLLPGVIDEHVHFREPGLTTKADIASESKAAAAGGVTSFFDMPNTVPTTTTMDAWQNKMSAAARESVVNYAFFFGATRNNSAAFKDIDLHHTPGVKLFMGASTGNMLVDDSDALHAIFRNSPLTVMTHCEDSSIITRNAAAARSRFGDDVPVAYHSEIRSEECCVRSTELAIRLARAEGARLHVAHVSTAKELEMIGAAGPDVTGEACLSHLLFCEDDYAQLGARIKCNPSVKTAADRDALRRALNDDQKIFTVATDHAPHLLSEKEGGALKAASGMPMIQFSLPAMLTLSDEGVVPMERVVELMCHNPARLFGVERRGYIHPGYKADLVLLKHEPHTVEQKEIMSKCGWSPLEGWRLNWRVVLTMSNGSVVYRNGRVDTSRRGEPITFEHRA